MLMGEMLGRASGHKGTVPAREGPAREGLHVLHVSVLVVAEAFAAEAAVVVEHGAAAVVVAITHQNLLMPWVAVVGWARCPGDVHWFGVGGMDVQPNNKNRCPKKLSGIFCM